MPKISHCRLCKSPNLVPYLDLGFTPLADGFLSPDELHEPETHYPLVVVLCQNCGLSQLNYTVDPKILYQKDYPYAMSLTKSGTDHYHGFAKSVAQKLGLTEHDLVVDVGGNVGVLLQGFKQCGMRVLNVDPAQNIAKIAVERGIETVADFFTPDTADAARKKHGRAKLIVGTNVFAHIYDHHEFMVALKSLLSEDGVFIFESPHFLNLVQNLEYDTIYHEHLLYLALNPVARFFKEHGMEVFDVETHQIHGGSFRVFVGFKGRRRVEARVAQVLEQEASGGIYSLPHLKQFAERVHHHRRTLMDLLYDLRRRGKSVALVSVPAKGMTLLNFCRIGPELVGFATERSELKIGRFTPGTRVPIFGDEELLARQPDYAFLLAWNFGEEIMENLSEYKKRGGKFIIPIPEPRIL